MQGYDLSYVGYVFKPGAFYLSSVGKDFQSLVVVWGIPWTRPTPSLGFRVYIKKASNPIYFLKSGGQSFVSRIYLCRAGVVRETFSTTVV